MIDSGEHIIFIVLAYGGVALVSLALIILNIVTYQKQKNRVKKFEEQGISLRDKRQDK